MIQKYFVVNNPCGQAAYKVESGRCSELLAGFTDLHHTLNFYHDEWIGKTPEEYCHSFENFAVITDIDPTIKGDWRLNDDCLHTIYNRIKADAPEGFDTASKAIEDFRLFIGQWWHSEYHYEKILSLIEFIKTNEEFRERLLKRLRRAIRENTDSYTAQSRNWVYLNRVKRWMKNPKYETMPHFKWGEGCAFSF